MITRTLFLFALIAVAFGQTGNSYCNSGTCSTSGDCDLGICCSSKCVQTPPTVLAKDAACTASDLCTRCANGQYCASGTCTDLPAASCKNSSNCACTASSDCESGYCGSDSKCHKIGLLPGDSCVDNTQCSSTNCTGGKCLGFALNDSCSPFTDSISPSCQAGLYCLSAGLTGSCAQGLKIGDDCKAGDVCRAYESTCYDAKCADAYQGENGDPCVLASDCAQPATCTKSNCTTVPSGNCKAASCGVAQSCGCTSDNKGTKCYNSFCATEHSKFVTCMRTNGCVTSAFTFDLYAVELCSYKNCLSELMDESCCRYCGTGSLNTIVAPSAGLDCGAKKFTPTMHCDSKCTIPPNTCGGSSTGTQTGGTQTGGTQTGGTQASTTGSSDASTMTVGLLAAVVIAAFFL